jgi:hypothetical protein
MSTASPDRNPLLTAALAAAERGWRVFPLRPGTKKPALHGDSARHPCPRTGICRDGHQKWEQRGMTDPDQIRWYWTSQRYRGCNVGIATGPSGLVVVDLDTPKSPDEMPPDGWSRRGIRDGHDVFAAVCADAGHPVPWQTLTVTTPRGGTHLYFRAPGGVRLGNTQGDDGHGLGWLVDTRGWGGYVVAPGSTTSDGTYRLTEDVELADLPAWLVQALTPKPPAANSAPVQIRSERLPAYVSAAVQGECDRVAAAQSGQHTRALFVASVALGQLVGAGALPAATAEASLYTAATHMITGQCRCTNREVTRTIGNGLRAGASRPRQVPA